MEAEGLEVDQEAVSEVILVVVTFEKSYDITQFLQSSSPRRRTQLSSVPSRRIYVTHAVCLTEVA